MLISATEAVARLKVKPATLYAYVSRGLIRSAPQGDGRAHGYYAEDVERLRQKRRGGRRASAPLKAFDAVTPVLDSAVCLIEDGRLYYRGQDAVALAEHATLEQTAALLWTAEPEQVFAAENLPRLSKRSLRDLPADPAPIERARAVLGHLAAEDLGAVDPTPANLLQVGARLVRALASAVTGALPEAMPVHLQLAQGWKLDPTGADLLRRALVLVADHELNASTYVARCVASTGATPYAVVLAGLSALSGPRHGAAASRTEAVLADLSSLRDPGSALADFLRRGERLPGFGHPLYPQGDPRATAILRALEAGLPRQQLAPMLRIAKSVSRLITQPPNVDFALGALSVALGLPRGAALSLFLVGRSVGWIAHAMEQYATGELIRPRARYVGPLPAPGSDGRR